MILASLFGFLLGIFLSSLLAPLSGVMIFVYGVCAAGVLSLGAVFLWKKVWWEKYRNIFLISLLCVLGIVLGVGRLALSPLRDYSSLVDVVGKKVTLEGIVVDEPDVREKETRLTVSVRSAEVDGKSAEMYREKIILPVPRYPEYAYGDRIRVATTLHFPRAIEGDDGRVFNYAGYLKARDIFLTATKATPEFMSAGHGSLLVSGLLYIKRAFTLSIDKAIPPPYSSLMAGLLLGSKRTLGSTLLDEFSQAGVSHIVVLSGYNIVIVAESIVAVFAFLPAGFSLLLASAGIILFTVLAGAGASAVRATVMVLVALFARASGRQYMVDRAFLFTVVVMLVWNPLLLVFDPSFQLSVLATFGLIFIAPILEPYLSFVTTRLGLREIISSTLATQLVVLPFLIYTNGIVSLVSLPVNILLLSFVPLTMFLGFVVGMTGFFSLYLSYIPAVFAYVFLWYDLAVVHTATRLHYGWFTLDSFSPLLVVVLYISIFSFLYFLREHGRGN